jgi:hypothetical protein
MRALRLCREQVLGHNYRSLRFLCRLFQDLIFGLLRAKQKESIRYRGRGVGIHTPVQKSVESPRQPSTVNTVSVACVI